MGESQHAKKKDGLTVTLALAGTALVWFPILAPIVFAFAALLTGRGFRFDYLMPAELFPVVLVGWGLLMWAAMRAHAHRGIIGGGFGVAVLALVGAQGLAVVTGLASGETEIGGWQWALVLAGLAVFWLALIAVGVGGALLSRDLFGRAHSFT